MDKSLVQFLAVAEEGTISGAAASLLVTQPTLTFNMRKLEETLGVRLFERSSRGVKLTPYGETLYENVTIMSRLYKNALNAIERQRIQSEEGLSIGTGYSWWALFLKRLVFEYGNRTPGAPVNVSLGNKLRCMDQLLAGDISLFIGHRIDALAPGVQADFIEIGLVHDGYFVREDHPLLGGVRTQAEVAAYPSTLAFPPEARQQRLLLGQGYGQSDGQQPEYLGHAFTSNSLEACLEYLRASDAVMRHTDLMAGEFARKGIAQVKMKPDQEPAYQPVGIHVLPERRSDKRLAGLIDRIYEEARAIVAGTAPSA